MINYTDITKAIADYLSDADKLEKVSVLVEPSEVGVSPYNEVGVFLVSEKNTERNLGSGNPYLSLLEVSVFCSAYSPDGAYEASKERDILLGNVRDVLKADRTLGGACDQTQLGDTTFQTAQHESGFFSAANLTLRVYVTS